MTTVRHVARAVGSTGPTVPAFRVDLRVGPHLLVADEPRAAGDVVLGAIAARTSRIHLGSAVTVISSDDPVRVFQRYATLDAHDEHRALRHPGRTPRS